jgi:hypothetical protein|tara:strand:- start:630 stop:764 length:135 start_codon:yes stop_codon:yes gene_type:complete
MQGDDPVEHGGDVAHEDDEIIVIASVTVQREVTFEDQIARSFSH